MKTDDEVHSYSVFCEEPEIDLELKRILIIVNPKSGRRKGLNVLERVRPILENGGCTVKVSETQYAGHARVLAEEEDLSNIDVLGVIGGDGTLHEIVNGFMSRKVKKNSSVTLCMFPAGTGNTVAYDLKITSPEKAAEIILKGLTRRIDVGVLDKVTPSSNNNAEEGRLYWINICGYALPTTVLELANRLRFLGGAQYDIAGKISLVKNKGYECKIEMIDANNKEHTLEGNYFMVQAQITVHMGDKWAFAPDAKLDDGLMDLILVERKGVGKMLSTMLAAQRSDGSHLQKECVHYHQVKQFKLTPILSKKNKLQGDKTVNLDGELVGFSPFVATIAHKAIRFVAE